MSCSDRTCIYDKTHVIPIFDKNRQMEERNLNISVYNFKDTLQIKIRDPLEYCFNYTEQIDLGDFEVMRVNQSLDINFIEFKSNLLEMLQQFQKKEMFLKCEVSNQKCTLVFYGKSKIKFIDFLTVDLHMTNQKEVFAELISSMQQMQESNDRYKKQLSSFRKSVSEKDQRIQTLSMHKIELEKTFSNNLKQVHDMFNMNVKNIENVLMNKITLTKCRIEKLLGEVELIKSEAGLRSSSSARLVQIMESLRLETIENASTINQLKKEIGILQSVNSNQDRNLADMRKSIQDKELVMVELQKKNEELRADLEKATIIITQKKATIEELSRDLVQANQMLVNFNNHYDNKVKEIKELQDADLMKDKIIRDQQIRTKELLREFEEYKTSFNSDEQAQLNHQLIMAHNKIEELESKIRKANKINTLLTDKVNNQNLGLNHK